ncbi:hypothetical protein BJX66DRAFT_342969 [Aspergillus keveii]|uniref:Cell wall protein n=1 Tax=Aspergillus keveii TaxID=714993 RepID=A0ABR4FQQ7_9EURO
MAFKMLLMLLLSLFTFTFTLAVPTQQACSLLAAYTQNQLTNISPLLEYAANSLEASNENGNEPRDRAWSTRQSKSPEITNYLNALSDALTQIGIATGEASNQFLEEITQACRDGAESRKRSEGGEHEVDQEVDAEVDQEVGQDKPRASLVQQVYASISVVINYSRRHHDDLDGLLGGLLDSVGSFLEEVLDAVGDLLDGLL